MLVIRLQRIGKKHQPSYRIAVAERRSKLGAPPAEDLGSYNAFSKAMNVNKERLEHWIKVGAKPTVTLNNLFVSKGILSSAKIPVKMKKVQVAEQAQTPAAEHVSAVPVVENTEKSAS